MDGINAVQDAKALGRAAVSPFFFAILDALLW